MRIPKYCRHKSSGQAIVWLGRKCYYLGAYGSAVSKKAYEARIREWLEQDRSHVDMSDITIAQVGARYWAEQKRRHGYASGRKAGSVETMHQTVRRLSLWAEDMRAVEFGPKALDEFRQGLIEEGLSLRLCDPPGVREGGDRAMESEPVAPRGRDGDSQEVLPGGCEGRTGPFVD